MAWWSLYKWFGVFRTVPYENMISWYRGKLYHEWYESLSDEEKAEYRKKQKEREKRNGDALAQLMATYAKVAEKCNSSLFLKD